MLTKQTIVYLGEQFPPHVSRFLCFRGYQTASRPPGSVPDIRNGSLPSAPAFAMCRCGSLRKG
jgi:hypothetical protein